MESEDELDMHDAHDDDGSVDNEEDFYSGGDDDGAAIDSDDADVGDYEFVDNDSDDSDDMVSYRHQQNYIILAEADIQQRQEEDIMRVSTVLSISKVAASILLRYYNWSVSKVHDEWFADEEKVRTSVGLLEKPVLPHSNELELPCGICFEIYSRDKIQSAACGHPFCNACWTGYISTSINDGPGCLMLRCPDPSCGAAVGQDMINLLASDDDKKKYFRYFVRSYVEDNRKTKWCPAPGCDYAVDFIVGSGSYDVTCKCSYSFCWNCTEEAHRPVDCVTVARWILKNSAESENMNWILANSKPCPKCKRPIEKNQGCMHITCTPPCKFEFCWLCLGPWSDHGERTGGFYACNRYETAKQDQEADKDAMSNSTAAPAELLATAAPLAAAWPANITTAESWTLGLLPVVSLILIYVLLRVVWKVPHSLPRYHAVPSYGAPNETTALNPIQKPKTSLVEEGEVAGDYEESWLKTFDFVFLLGMALYFVVMVVLTKIYQPELLTSGKFWLMQLPKLGVMMLVSLLGGIVCRHYCDVDEKGYIITNKSSAFKVNYTRKLQHFAAYMVPLVIKSDSHGPLALAWGDFFSMLGFLVLIKPIREHSKFFMLQFNSLDRPEDRPNTLKWIIAGNIAPGMFILLFFKWLFADQGALTFIIVFITGIGDGLAEPVGITWGKHKYKTHSCFSKNKYTRSWEGSACVFMSGMIFPALQYADFDNFTQVLLSMLILGPTMAYAEATAPHTMDTPVLMIGCGAILYAITNLF